MNMDPIKNRIEEEARRRASAQLDSFSIAPMLDQFGLDPDTEITIRGQITRTRTFNVVELELSQLDGAIRQALLDVLSKEIAQQLADEFAKKTESLDLTSFEVTKKDNPLEVNPPSEVKPALKKMTLNVKTMTLDEHRNLKPA
jgi:hypothetical protein